ncbi:Conserved_hypothetical protein [Hexamita inflata]|uniref:Myb-like domain-containing protein n=1 Tax=Hexamita inflata TaxID=28002 RepID=A0AA86TKA3_9EUKA|nr:Conserved hypothetical protein [Hexamita inflata]CAI9956813.1 Conserved hypothetical protein [Hexamita inflata]
MQKQHKSQFWTQTEKQTFFLCLELFQNDFNSYTFYLQRSYSQIKCFYHNWLKTLPLEKRQMVPRNSRGGKHIAFRNQVGRVDMGQLVLKCTTLMQ